MNRNDLEVKGLAKPVEATDLAEVEAYKQWLRTYAKKKRRQKARCIWSYNLKHIIENATGGHITRPRGLSISGSTSIAITAEGNGMKMI